MYRTLLALARVIVAALCILVPGETAAQIQGEGYGVLGVGGYARRFASGLLGMGGGGGEVLHSSGFGAGGEAGLIFGAGDLASHFSGYGVVHFHGSSSTKLVPFAGGGYTYFLPITDSGASHAGHIRGGLNYWYRQNRALRIEFFDILRRRVTASDQFWFVRVGLTFR